MASTKKMTMEERLAMYRKRKRREEDIAAMKQKIWNFFTSFTLWGRPGDTSAASVQSPGEGEKVDEETKRLPNTSGNTVKRWREKEAMTEDIDLPETEPLESQHYTRLDWLLLLLKVVLWLLLLKIFALLEFGLVFFIFSAFFFIWYNLRSGPKKKGEKSAYSVFNPNCEAIDGTVTAEQMQRELLLTM